MFFLKCLNSHPTKRSRTARLLFCLYYGTMAVICPLQGPVLPFLFTQCAYPYTVLPRSAGVKTMFSCEREILWRSGQSLGSVGGGPSTLYQSSQKATLAGFA